MTFTGTNSNTYSGQAVIGKGPFNLSRTGEVCLPGAVTIGGGTANATLHGNGQLADTSTVTVLAQGTYWVGDVAPVHGVDCRR